MSVDKQLSEQTNEEILGAFWVEDCPERSADGRYPGGGRHEPCMCDSDYSPHCKWCEDFALSEDRRRLDNPAPLETSRKS